MSHLSARTSSLSLLAVCALSAIHGCGGSSNGSNSSDALLPVAFTRIGQLSQGLLLYAGDYDDTLPARTWADATLPYVHDAINYRSPAVEATGYGFAFNSALLGVRLSAIVNRDATPLVFDSTDLSWNAAQLITTAPSPPRYGDTNVVAYADGRTNAPITDFLAESLNRVKKQSVALAIYASDYDDYTPPAGHWMDSLRPYVVSESTFHDPALAANQYGYAMRPQVAGKSISSFANPATEISIFDSTNTARNAVADINTLPLPGRYMGKNVEAFLDGHAISF